ncbi:hypothetical protein [Streptomyces sp. 4N124]
MKDCGVDSETTPGVRAVAGSVGGIGALGTEVRRRPLKIAAILLPLRPP